MMVGLRIQGLGVIEDAAITLGPGLTVLTGETGAGKTMVLSGLALLAGAKAESGAVRAGKALASVDGEWLLNVDDHHDLVQRLEDAGADLEVDDGVARVLLARTVAAEGRSKAFAGGRSVPAGVLQEASGDLIAVHGQADQMRLRQADRQRDVLDRFAGLPATQARQAFTDAYRKWRATTAELAALLASRQERQREAVLLTAGIEEIEAVEPRPGEDVELDRLAARLAHVGSLMADLRQAREALVGEEDSAQPGQGGDAMSALSQAARALDRVLAVDPTLQACRDRLRDVGILISDIVVDLSQYAAGIEADPNRQAWVEERRSALAGLRRRYGADVDQVLAWLEQARLRVSQIDTDQGRIEECEACLADLVQQARDRAATLTEVRLEAAERLATIVTDELHALAMPHATFSVRVDTVADPDDYSSAGADTVEFLLEPHRGGGMRPIGKGASGGELSRIMLAIEVALAGADPVPTFVFDEVDAGVGGRAAVEVGRRLARLARSAQVLVVTHLPQVAAFADQHVVVAKGGDGLVTSSSVRIAEGEERVLELVRMLSGLDASQAGAAHAQELLEVAATERGTEPH